MRALFTSFPAFGHVIPLAPLMSAAGQAGDDVVLAVDEQLRGVSGAGRFRALPPSTTELLAEITRRTEQDTLAYRTDGTPGGVDAAVVELFTSARADRSYDELDRLIERERPDVVVAEMWDFLAPVVAAARGLPWVPVNHSPSTPLDGALADGMFQVATARGIEPTAPLVTLQQWPVWMAPAPLPAVPTLPLRPEAHAQDEPVTLPTFESDAPTVLVTLGTVVEDTVLLRAAVSAALAAGANVIATAGLTPQDLGDLGADPRVRLVDFVPLRDLLGLVDAVVAAGGSGTTLAALGHGLPMVFVPRIANQPLVAGLVAERGAGLIGDDDLQAAVHAVLHEPGYRKAAAELAGRLAELPDAVRTWAALTELVRRHGSTPAEPS